MDVSNNVEDIYPLSPMQESILFDTLYHDTAFTYHQHCVYRIRGKVDLVTIQQGLEYLCRRHTVLRTSFVYEGFDAPLQVVLKKRNIPFSYLSIVDIVDEEDAERALNEIKIKNAKNRFDLTGDALMRVLLIALNEDEYEFIWTFHHIILDGWSVGILLAEFKQICNAIAFAKPFNPENASSYAIFIKWLSEKNQQTFINFWSDYIKDFNKHAGRLPHKQKTEHVFKSDTSVLQLGDHCSQSIRNICNSNNVTLNIYLRTIWGIVLAKYNHANDVVFGAVVSGRPPEIHGIDAMVGLFINTLPVRVRFENDYTLSELLRTAQAEALNCEKNQYISLSLIKQTKEPLFDHVFIFQNYPKPGADSYHDIQDLTSLDIAGESDVQEDFYHDFVVRIPSGENISFELIYNSNLYDQVFIDLLIFNLQKLLILSIHNSVLQLSDYSFTFSVTAAASVAISRIIDDGPDTNNMTDLSAILKQDAQTLLGTFNATDVLLPEGKNVIELIKDRVKEKPFAIALEDSKSVMSYHELDVFSNRVANTIINKGIAQQEVIAVLSDRNVTMVAAISGILKACNVYLPLGITYPVARIGMILNESRTKLLMLNSRFINAELIATLNDCDDLKYLLLLDRQYTHFPASLKATVITMEELGNASFTDPSRFVQLNDLCYILYTSGSTGKPKGVMVEHGGMLNHLLAKIKDLKLNARSVLAQNASQTFVVSIWQMFAGLVAGGKTVVFDDDLTADPNKMIAELSCRDITVIELVPTYLTKVLDILDAAVIQTHFPLLTFMVVTGEPLKGALTKRWFNRFPDIPLMNAYGQTEASDDIAHYILNHPFEADNVPIGRALQNMRIYILDDNLQLCPIGSSGEICVSGIGVSRGYVSNINNSSAAFIEDPFRVGEKVRLYRSGDLGRYNEDGVIVCYGRKDSQVKIRGQRIEPGEIEARLMEIAAVKEAVVLVKEDSTEDQQLIAYIICTQQVDPDVLKRHLRAWLPSYMIPSVIIPVLQFPLNSHGKIDRLALLAEPPVKINRSEPVTPASPVELKMKNAWEEALGLTDIGIHDDFFELGGHSLKALKLVAAISRHLGIKVELKTILDYPTISELSQVIMSAPELAIENHVSNIDCTVIHEGMLYYEITPIQKYWLDDNEDRAYKENDSSHGIFKRIYEITGGLDIAAFTQALAYLVERHESLRSTFHNINGRFMMRIEEFSIADAQPLVVDLTHMGETLVLEDHPFIQFHNHKFSDSAGPLLQVRIALLAGNRHALSIKLHHVIIDAWSYEIILRDLMVAYAAYSTNSYPYLPLLKYQFKDFLSSSVNFIHLNYTAHKEYWLNLYEGLPPVPEIPASRIAETTAFNTKICKSTDQVLYRDFVMLIESASKKYRTSVFVILQAGFRDFMLRTTGQQDILIGTFVFGRVNAASENQVGNYARTILLRTILDKADPFSMVVKKVKQSNEDASIYTACTLMEVLSEMVPAGQTIMNSAWKINMQFVDENGLYIDRSQLEDSGPGLVIKSVVDVEKENRIFPIDMQLYFSYSEERLELRTDYDSSRYTAAAINEFILRYLNYMYKILKNEVPEKSETKGCEI